MIALFSEAELLVKCSATTDERYGTEPDKRTVAELLKFGCINLDKPCGPSSHQVTSWVKQILNIEKAGHGGTLDPRVTGVLPIALNNAVKALRVFLYGNKEYVGVMRVHKTIPEELIRKTCSQFVGEIEQLPPVRAAVKRKLRKRKIYELKILEIEGRDVLFRVACQAGTYIRTLANDIGKKLGTGAHLQELRRTRTCGFEEKESFTLHNLKDAFVVWKEAGEEEELRKIILPFEKTLEHLPKVIVRDSAIDSICHGAKLAIPGIVKIDKAIERGSVVGIFSLKHEGIAFGRALLSSKEMLERSEGYAIAPERVFMMPGTYPRSWKKLS